MPIILFQASVADLSCMKDVEWICLHKKFDALPSNFSFKHRILSDDDDNNNEDELFLWYGWSTKDV